MIYYLNTNNKETKKNIYHLMCMLLYYNPSASYQTKRYGVDIKEEDLYKEEPFDLQGIYTEVAEECAQEFIKVRLGGKFNSNDRDLNEVVFRIASTGFNWFDNICNFLISHKKDIESVTIVRDKELTGNEEVYSIDGEEIYRYPVEDFIMIKGRPIIESKYDFLNKLSRGNTILEAYGVSNFRHALSEFYHYRKFDKFEM